MKKYLRRIYKYSFGRPLLQKVNDSILEFSLCSKGYNNCCDANRTGELKFIKLISTYIQPQKDIIIDIGAHQGDYCSKMREIFGDDVNIIAFEPEPNSYKKLREKFQGIQNIELINIAISNRVGSAEFYFDEIGSQTATLLKDAKELEYINNSNSITVDTTTLDSYFKNENHDNKNIAFIKIDTEGFEYEAIEGGIKTIKSNRVKAIQFEYNQHYMFKNNTIFKFTQLLSEDYDLFRILPYGKINLVKVTPKSPTDNLFAYSNYVFIRKDLVNLTQ